MVAVLIQALRRQTVDCCEIETSLGCVVFKKEAKQEPGWGWEFIGQVLACYVDIICSTDIRSCSWCAVHASSLVLRKDRQTDY